MHTLVQSGALAVSAAVEELAAGGLLAFPTETVYGLGADARRDDAVAKIYTAKGRPIGNPLIVHVANEAAAQACVNTWPAAAEKLSAAFWPGPLTIILDRGPGISPSVSAGRSTVAVRCPRHPIAHALLSAFDGPLAAPSANRSGFTSPTTAAHVLAELSGRIPLIIDGGPCEIGLESTVIDLSASTPTVLRHGAVTLEMLRAILGEVRSLQTTVAESDSAASPGQHSRHYAPRTRAYRFHHAQWPEVQQWLACHESVALLSADERVFIDAPAETTRMPSDAASYARILYAALREADEKNLSAILVLMPPQEDGLWAAVADRLRRATEPFPASDDTSAG